ncbi:MAG: hypothetical protein WD960_09725 [Gemmatimonadota bacterium]
MTLRSGRVPTLVQRIAAGIALLFGLATLGAGLRMLLGGSDPGYAVFAPLLVFNTVMGAAYLAAGVTAWRSARWGRNGAGTLLLVNLMAWGAVSLVHARGGAVALESLRAMGFRSGVWMALFLALAWAHRRVRRGERASGA